MAKPPSIYFVDNDSDSARAPVRIDNSPARKDNSPAGETHVPTLVKLDSQLAVIDVSLSPAGDNVSPAGDRVQTVLYASGNGVCIGDQLVNKPVDAVIDVMSPAGDNQSPAGDSLSPTAVGVRDVDSSRAVVVDVFDYVPLCGRIPVCFVNVPEVSEPIFVYNDCLWGTCSCVHYHRPGQITVDPL